MVNVSLNLVLAGVLDAVLGTGAPGFFTPIFAQDILGINVFLASNAFVSQATLQLGSNAGFGVTNPQGISGLGAIVPGPLGFTALLETPAVPISVGPNPFELRILARAGAVGNGTFANVGFLNSLEPPTGVDVFDFFDPVSGAPISGYTANAGDWLVNNRFIAGPTQQVPAPATVLLLVAGLLALMVQRRRGLRPAGAR